MQEQNYVVGRFIETKHRPSLQSMRAWLESVDEDFDCVRVYNEIKDASEQDKVAVAVTVQRVATISRVAAV
jgi:hypothetical protein